MRQVRIGNGAGFWGDNLDAPQRLVAAGRLDYLTLEYLAELTLSILAHLRSRDPKAGFVPDLLTVIADVVDFLKQQPNLKIVSNGGGMNPTAAAIAVGKLLVNAALPDVKVSAVSGDDILPELNTLRAAGEAFRNFDSGALPDEVWSKFSSANVYLGADGIVSGLSQGARIVVTGRVADASLTVGPAVHELGWSWTQHAELAAATAAGHLIECGAQCTGGMYSAYSGQYSLEEVGYPIAELSENGDCRISKPPGSGGCVSPETVSEQLVYEIGDPAAYLTPDLTADFSRISLRSDSENQVSVTGARGTARPDRYKVSMSYRDGFIATGTLVLFGHDSHRMAQLTGELILKRFIAAGLTLRRSQVEVIGGGACDRGAAAISAASGTVESAAPFGCAHLECTLRVTVHVDERAAAERFIREFSPMAGSGPPGVTGYTGPRSKPVPVYAYWPTTISRDHVRSVVVTRTAKEWSEQHA